MRKTIDPQEMKTRQLMEFVLVVLAQSGGTAKEQFVVERVGEMLHDSLRPADLVPVYHRPGDGREDIAPEGAERTWPVWAGKATISFLHAKGKGWITRSKGVCTLTPEGMKHVALYAENWLKAGI